MRHQKKHIRTISILIIITLLTKLTMAVAGCSGSSSANTWHWLSAPRDARATNANIRLYNKTKCYKIGPSIA